MATHQLLTHVIPQFFPARWLDEAPDIVWTNFPSRIRIGYVIRAKRHYSYVMRPALEESRLAVGELHDAALKNLQDLGTPELTVGKTPGGSEAFLTNVDDNFRAARILLPTVQEALADELGDEFFVAIPCRDWFMCWSKHQDGDWQTRNVTDARNEFLDDDYRLTPDILLRSNTGFSLHLEQVV